MRKQCVFTLNMRHRILLCSVKQAMSTTGNIHFTQNTVLVLIRLAKFAVEVRFHCGCSNLIFCLFHQFLRYLITMCNALKYRKIHKNVALRFRLFFEYAHVIIFIRFHCYSWQRIIIVFGSSTSRTVSENENATCLTPFITCSIPDRGTCNMGQQRGQSFGFKMFDNQTIVLNTWCFVKS